MDKFFLLHYPIPFIWIAEARASKTAAKSLKNPPLVVHFMGKGAASQSEGAAFHGKGAAFTIWVLPQWYKKE